MTSFIYKPISLADSAFRLLRLLQGKDYPIRCQLFESSLALLDEHFGDYAALSYTWGSASTPCDIMINESMVAVTKNAYLALRDLRYKEKDRVIWIDALCIDQSNIEERGQQVQQMGSIYSKAARVIIWLGEATYDTDFAIDCMQQLENEKIRLSSDKGNVSDEQWTEIWSALARNLRADQKDLLTEGFRSLLGRTWFRRVWIIQETANAQAAELLCGRRTISTNTFARMTSLLQVVPDSHCQPILDIMPGSSRHSSWWAEKRDLYTLLIKFSKSEATDPRDHIYALLGISSNACNAEYLKADYTKDLQDVIFDTVAFLFDFHKLSHPTLRFFDWSLREFWKNLHVLSNEVLFNAIRVSNTAIVKLLMARSDVDINFQDDDRRTPLWHAASRGHEEIVRLLLVTGKVDIDCKDRRGQTPLSVAAEAKDERVAKLLLETGKVDIDSKDEGGRTPLWWAVSRGRCDAVVKLLLETDEVDINVLPNSRQTLLWWAANLGNVDLVQLLINTGRADVDVKDVAGRTPLWIASRKGYEAIVKLLIKTKTVDPDSTDNRGRTPLSQAARFGFEEVVKLLLETEQVDVHYKDVEGRDPLSWAKAEGNEVVMEAMQSYIGRWFSE